LLKTHLETFRKRYVNIWEAGIAQYSGWAVA
jgi:hypothetical protein